MSLVGGKLFLLAVNGMSRKYEGFYVTLTSPIWLHVR